MTSADQETPTVNPHAASVYQVLHGLAAGRLDAQGLVAEHLAAIEEHNGRLNAVVALNKDAQREAIDSDARRAAGRLGRLDGISVLVKDNIDVAGMPTTVGLAGREHSIAAVDAAVVERLRLAGAIILGKTQLDEGALGTTGNNPHSGATHNPFRHGYVAGGSSGGSAVAVATGMCSFAIGSDTLGSIRIPASHCGVYGLRPTPGEISTRGLSPGARRLDSIGLLTRSVEDMAIVLRVIGRFDEQDPRSRRRRVPLSIPDWDPRRLRTGFLPNLEAIGVSAPVRSLFATAVQSLTRELGEHCTVDFSGYDFPRMRRAALLVMESELAVEWADLLDDENSMLSPRLRDMLDFARRKSAPDYVAVDRELDQAVVLARRIFADVDVLVMPTVPHGPYPLDGPEQAGDADLTSFASLAGCPAISMPMGTLPDGMPAGMQLIGRPGSDLRLLELAGICAANLDAAPAYPVSESAR